MTFDEWWARQPKDPTQPIGPRMAWNAAIGEGGDAVLKTMLEVYDVLDDPVKFRTALAAAVAKREKRPNEQK